MNLQIVYQDDWLVAVDKPAGHLVHPAELPQEGDLVTMKILRDQIGQRVYNVHRLDRPTTGVLLFALDREVGKSLHRAFENHAIKKKLPSCGLWEAAYGIVAMLATSQ